VKQKQFFEQLPERLAAIPGAQGASVSSGLPGVNPGGRRIVPEGKIYAREQDRPEVRTLSVTPGFFTTFDLKVRQGREFTQADTKATPQVAIVSQKFVDTHFPGVDPIGRRFRYAGGADSLVWRSI